MDTKFVSYLKFKIKMDLWIIIFSVIPIHMLKNTNRIFFPKFILRALCDRAVQTTSTVNPKTTPRFNPTFRPRHFNPPSANQYITQSSRVAGSVFIVIAFFVKFKVVFDLEYFSHFSWYLFN